MFKKKQNICDGKTHEQIIKDKTKKKEYLTLESIVKNDDSDSKKIREALDQCTPELKKNIKKMYILEWGEFCEEHYFSAHAHREKDALSLIICFNEEAYDKSTVVHEAAHIYSFSLDKLIEDFYSRWGEISKINYGDEILEKEKKYSDGRKYISYKWKDGSENSKFGCTGPYGGSDIDEDIADFVESAYAINESVKKIELRIKKKNSSIKPEALKKRVVEELKHENNEDHQLIYADKKDKRYKEKLEFLYEMSFLTTEQFDNSMNYLGKLFSSSGADAPSLRK